MNIGDIVFYAVSADEHPCGCSIGLAEITEVWKTPKTKQPRYRLRGMNMTHDGCETCARARFPRREEAYAGRLHGKEW